MTSQKLLVLLLLFFAIRSGDAQTAAPSFEVATIKPTSATDGHTHINYPPGDSFSAINMSVLSLMQWAYDMPEAQILDGPSWLKTTRFDIVARADMSGQSTAGTPDRKMKQQMVQALLAERLKLAVHRETRSLPAYDMVVAKGGAKLEVSKVNGKSVGAGRDHLTVQGLTADLVAEELSKVAGRVVVDKTGLTERYDFKLTWAADDAVDGGSSLFTAIQEQLGLKLEAAKEAVPVLVIDRVEMPSAN